MVSKLFKSSYLAAFKFSSIREINVAQKKSFIEENTKVHRVKIIIYLRIKKIV